MQFTNNLNRSARSIILDNLSWATHVDFAVAFVRKSGLNLIKNQLETIISNGGKIRVLAGQDFGFTEPEAISSLVSIGAEVKIFVGEQIFHPKCYIFRSSDRSSVLIGSSNLTTSGIEDGIEWNVAIDNVPELSNQIDEGFNQVWESVNAKEISDELLNRLAEQHSQTGKTPEQNVIAQRFDVAAEGFRFQFKVNHSFLDQSNHPITIPKRHNDILDRIIIESNTKVNVYSKDKHVVCHIYRGFSGRGKYYQLSIQGHKYFQIENNFRMNQLLDIEVKFYKDTVHIYLLN